MRPPKPRVGFLPDVLSRAGDQITAIRTGLAYLLSTSLGSSTVYQLLAQLGGVNVLHPLEDRVAKLRIVIAI